MKKRCALFCAEINKKRRLWFTLIYIVLLYQIPFLVNFIVGTILTPSGIHPLVSQWCILHIPPYFNKIYKLSPYFHYFSFFGFPVLWLWCICASCLNTYCTPQFIPTYILTDRHACFLVSAPAQDFVMVVTCCVNRMKKADASVTPSWNYHHASLRRKAMTIARNQFGKLLSCLPKNTCENGK